MGAGGVGYYRSAVVGVGVVEVHVVDMAVSTAEYVWFMAGYTLLLVGMILLTVVLVNRLAERRTNQRIEQLKWESRGGRDRDR